MTAWIVCGAAFLIFSAAIGCLIGRLLARGSLPELTEAEVRDLLGPGEYGTCEMCGYPADCFWRTDDQDGRVNAINLCGECFAEALELRSNIRTNHERT